MVRGTCTTFSSRGSALRIRGPRNHFALVEAKRYLFIAGGIGITPILPMVAQVDGRPAADWRLVYGGRTRTSMAFRDELDGPPSRAASRFTRRTSTACSTCPAARGAGHGRRRHRGLLLRPGSAARRGRAAMHRLAVRRAARGTVRPEGRRAATVLARHSRSSSSRPARFCKCPPDRSILDVVEEVRRRGALLVPGRHLRHLRDRGAVRDARPPRLRAHRRGAGGRRRDDDLRVPLAFPSPCPRPLTTGISRPPMSTDRVGKRLPNGVHTRPRRPANASECAAGSTRTIPPPARPQIAERL